MRELYANEEVLERGLTARVLPFIIERDEIPEEDEEERFVSAEARTAWETLVRNALTLRNRSYQIECSADARTVFRAFHNEAIRLRNGRYREIEGELWPLARKRRERRERSIHSRHVNERADPAGRKADPLGRTS